MQKILNLIKRIIPKKLFKLGQPVYHYFLSKLSTLIYGYPSNKMIVVGVTGTTGKSSSGYFMAQILEKAGFKVGMSTTTLFKVGSKEWLNDKKMTMIGRFQLQGLLKQMVKEKCDVAIVETTSEGIKQFRHLGISYDILVFTNLYPEHIESHGSFEKYKEAKGKLFKYLSKTKKKKVEKTIIANLDDKHSEYFLNFKADKKITYGIDKDADIKLNDLKVNLLGEYNIYNVLSGVAVANVLKVEEDKIKSAVADLKPLPGRLEFIENDKGIKILIDYAFEPKAVQTLYKIIKNIEHNKVIHILGSAGGGRDKDRRPILGKLAGQNADIVIVTNEDPYDEDPMEIINQISYEVDDNKLHKILDRREAIHKALELAEKGDLILLTGKGAEQKMCVTNEKMIDWDDREVIKEGLRSV
jgi:UDP-N-acetylmuramoyl-L-alanyl-D-glutamate--2,6-diaminopimelate ligase